MKNKQDQKDLFPVDPSVTEMFLEAEKNKDKKLPTMSFIPSFFTTASLPFKNVNKTVFVRKGSNGVTLTLTSPKNVPFGRYGRLLLSVLTTHAVLSKDLGLPVLLEYNSLADLLKELQLQKQRGTDIRQQLECFSNAAFSFEQKIIQRKSGVLFEDLYENGKYPKKDVTEITHSTGNIRFTNGVQFKEIDDGSGDNKYGRFKIILSPEFVEFCKAHSVPISYTAYKEITSPIGKDIYAWLVYRNNGITEPVFIKREQLVEQFMPVENDDKQMSQILTSNNYHRIIELITEIKQKYYPELNVNIDNAGAGITLYKSPTPVLKDDTRYALITSDI